MPPDLSITAIRYIEHGFSIVPIKTDGSKAPSVAWKQYQSRQATEDEVRAWWGSDGRKQGFAIVHGAVSGSSEVLDFDAPGAYDEWLGLCADHGFAQVVESCVLIETPSGGRHLLYRCPEGVEGNQKLARSKDGTVKIETRGEGGYTLAPGSPRECHPDGREYRILVGKMSAVPEITGEERAALLAFARACNELAEPENYHRPAGSSNSTRPAAEKRSAGAAAELLPGDDFNERGDSLPSLLKAGWEEIGRRGDTIDLRRPGKAGGGLSGTLNHMGPGIFHCFTTSAPPFEADHAYPPFSVFGLLECSGDFNEAAKRLRERGYGDQTPPISHKAKKYAPQEQEDQGEAATVTREPTPKLGEIGGEPPPEEDDVADPFADSDCPEETVVTASDGEAFKLTELGNAERLVARHGQDIRYSPAFGWLVWDGHRWQTDESGEVIRRMKHTTRMMYAEAAKLAAKAKSEGADEDGADAKVAAALAKWAKISESHAKITASIKLAESEPGVFVAAGDLDTNPWLLNAQNGTVDLRTGQLVPARREDLITKMTPIVYDPNAKAPLWDQCLERWQPDPDVRDFLRRAAGYTLTGETGEETAFFLFGTGRNGKSKFTEALDGIMGEYAGRAPIEIFMAGKGANEGNSPTPDKAELAGKRFVLASEIMDARRFNEAFIKDVTGGDKITAAKKYKAPFTFRPALKLWFYGNHKPPIKGTDDGIWARLPLVPWTVTIPKEERDIHLSEKLRDEYPGILAWAVKGCREWQKIRLSPPNIVLHASAQYRQEQDPFAGFFDACCVFHAGAWAKGEAVRERFKKWSGETDDRQIPSSKQFLERLGQLGAKSGTKRLEGLGVTRVWLGVGLKDETTDDTQPSENIFEVPSTPVTTRYEGGVCNTNDPVTDRNTLSNKVPIRARVYTQERVLETGVSPVTDVTAPSEPEPVVWSRQVLGGLDTWHAEVAGVLGIGTTKAEALDDLEAVAQQGPGYNTETIALVMASSHAERLSLPADAPEEAGEHTDVAEYEEVVIDVPR